jgi:hypothetical protein
MDSLEWARGGDTSTGKFDRLNPNLADPARAGSDYRPAESKNKYTPASALWRWREQAAKT